MRLLKQISLDGHPSLNLSSSLNTSRLSTDIINHNNNKSMWNNFGKNLSEILDRNIRLLKLIKHDNSQKNTNSLLKALEELNCCIVTLIEMCSTQSSSIVDNIKDNFERHKSKLRRHYSAFVDSGNLFRNKRSPSISGSTEKESTISPNDSIQTKCVIENSIHKLIESNILNLLVESMPNIGFEEKKISRIIITNSLTIDVKKNKVIVDYFCKESNNILRALVESYKHGKSDITLNCGCILRFASQFEPIVLKLLQSDYFYEFFTYMKRSSVDYPFDVAMDVFYTFKTFMTKHKPSTTEILIVNQNLFISLIELLKHAESTDDYVVRRQTLEMFTEIFSGPDRSKLREKFINQNDFICFIIGYLWNRNLQIRLRCLTLLSQFFIVNSFKVENTINSTTETEKWKTDLVIEKVKLAYREVQNKDESECVDLELKNCFIKLKEECLESNIEQFNLLSVFVDHLIHEFESLL